jgi:glycosyltransferase involved in cell wall biosynthesis
MSATLRVVLDQLVAPTSSDLAEAADSLTRALVATAPRGADVGAIVPRGDFTAPDGVEDVTRLALPRRELAASWPLGVAPGVGKGMIHAPTLLAPLVKHDRVHETHQVVATVWDLRPWHEDSGLPRTEVAWHRAMLKRAEKHADAVVVPAHAMADELATISRRLAGRIRVIAGAPPIGFRVPTDAAGRLRTLGIEGPVVAVAEAGADALRAAAGADAHIVVFDGGDEARDAVIRDHAAAAGVPGERITLLADLDAHDRASVLSAASLLIAPSNAAAWPWRAVEALAAGVPVVAADTAVHREVLADAALYAEPAGLADAVRAALGPAATRLRVLAGDRGRSFSWREAAERTWSLHAEL